jgi:hypothetical protein
MTPEVVYVLEVTDVDYVVRTPYLTERGKNRAVRQMERSDSMLAKAGFPVTHAWKVHEYRLTAD